MDGVDSSLQSNSQSLDIRPYQFEPLLVENNQEEDINSSSEESDIDDLSSNVDRLVNTNWCDCGNCNSMTTADECVCCSDISAVSYLMQPDDLNCITEHEVFIANCLNRHVLQVSMYAYMEHIGPFDDNEPINEKYRFMAYRRFVQWIWHRLGRHNRKILPACVVKKIRDSFPSEEYCGFKYAVV
ncbi:P2X purinoceptor 7-like [Mytilus trossulus]|uniref:P2X purinoceptor 7-like n=1 Tax=Mytilus trossulus TaxID=6551 RepID=UPI003006DFC1